MPNPELVTARDLDQWADSLAARSVLPRLVWRLILPNAAVTQIVMRSGVLPAHRLDCRLALACYAIDR
jgi:hypothetical protein